MTLLLCCFLQKFMQKLLVPIYAKFQRMTDVPSTFEGVKHQSLVLSWVCRFDVGDCKKQAKQLFDNWRNSPDSDNNNTWVALESPQTSLFRCVFHTTKRHCTLGHTLGRHCMEPRCLSWCLQALKGVNLWL